MTLGNGRKGDNLKRWLLAGVLAALVGPALVQAQDAPPASALEAPLAPAPVPLSPSAEAPLAPAPVTPVAPAPLAPVPVLPPTPAAEPQQVYVQPAPPAPVQEAYRPSGRDIVIAYNTGLRFSIAPGIFLPSHGGHVGFSIAGDMRFGFLLGPVIVAPGARLALFFPSGWVATTALATGRITVPLGPVAPFVMGGAGPGYVSEPSQTGLAWLGGGGLMVHFTSSFALGAEVSYQGITDTRFKALFVGPVLLLGF